MSNCPYHKTMLIQSKENPNALICLNCKKEKSPIRDGIYAKDLINPILSRKRVFLYYSYRPIIPMGTIVQALREAFNYSLEKAIDAHNEVFNTGEVQIDPNHLIPRSTDKFNEIIEKEGYSKMTFAIRSAK